MRYITDNPTIILPGTYIYALLSLKQAKEWLEVRAFSSRIGDNDILKDINTHIKNVLRVDMNIDLNDQPLNLELEDEALVIRISPVTPSPKTYHVAGESVSRITEKWEYGLLKKILYV